MYSFTLSRGKEKINAEYTFCINLSQLHDLVCHNWQMTPLIGNGDVIQTRRTSISFFKKILNRSVFFTNPIYTPNSLSSLILFCRRLYPRILTACDCQWPGSDR